MSVGIFFLIIAVVVILAVVAVTVAANYDPNARYERTQLREAEDSARILRERNSIATKALRSIANGAGNPILEASDALDRLESTYTKELN